MEATLDYVTAMARRDMRAMRLELKAAPKLYEALEGLLNALADGGPSLAEAEAQAERALAAARGEVQA